MAPDVTPVGTANATTPGAEYARRLRDRRGQAARHAGRYARLARGRNVALGLVVAILWLLEKERTVVLLTWLALPAAGFVALVLWRNRVARAWGRAVQAAAFYERRLACVEERWAGSGRPGTRYLDAEHPCALDLDLFGRGCLFERLNTATTRPGEDTLAAWLRVPATAEEVHERQAAVTELRCRLDLREDLTLLGADLPAGTDLAALGEWGKADAALAVPRWGPAAVAFPVLGLFALAGCLLGTGPLPLLAVLVLGGALTLGLHRPIHAVLAPAEAAAHTLLPLAGMLARLEREPFACPRLIGLLAALKGKAGPASRGVRRLRRLLSLAAPATVLQARVALAVAVEGWRRVYGADLARWVAALGEFEALCALAAYSYENPADPFPEVVAGGPCFEAEGLGHPLIPRQQCVANDVRLGGELRVVVVSGSNMAGKSTLLRSVGVAVVLALAGAPVRARRLRLSPLAVGATLRIQDSLQAGRSRFYAEVLRVRQLLDMAPGAPPLLFLLDELFQGTNSEDRRVGAEAVVRRLLDAGAVGLITTHDLALTAIADRLVPRAANAHFADHFEDGVMTFDYRMRPGVVQTSNGLALMRAVGIEV